MFNLSYEKILQVYCLDCVSSGTPQTVSEDKSFISTCLEQEKTLVTIDNKSKKKWQHL